MILPFKVRPNDRAYSRHAGIDKILFYFVWNCFILLGISRILSDIVGDWCDFVRFLYVILRFCTILCDFVRFCAILSDFVRFCGWFCQILLVITHYCRWFVRFCRWLGDTSKYYQILYDTSLILHWIVLYKGEYGLSWGLFNVTYHLFFLTKK